MLEHANDPDLLRRYAKEGVEAAFAELVRRYLPLVYHVAERQLGGDRHAAGDVAQKVFTLLARKAAPLAGHHSIAGWLHTTARLIARETIRAEQRRRAREQEAYRMSTLDHEPGRVDWLQLRPVLDDAIGELKPDDREALLLRFFTQLSHAEVATRLRVTENAARMRVERALEKLQARLARRGITSTAAALTAGFTSHAAAAVPLALANSITASALSGIQGAAGCSGAGGLLAIMNTSKAVWIGAVTLLLVALGGGTVVHTRSRSALERQAAEAEKLAAASQRRASELERRVRVASAENAALAQQLDASRANQNAAAANATATAAAAAAWDPETEGRALMDRHPALKQAVIDRADAITRYFYLPQLEEIGLTPAQVDAFIRVRREEGVISAPFGPNGMVYAFPAGDGVSPDELERRYQEAIGEDNYRKLEAVHRVGEARLAMFSLASKLALTDAPISAEQSEQFQRLLLSNRQPVKVRGQPNFDWDAVIAQAANVFSTAQLGMLGRVRAEAEQAAASWRPMPDMSRKKEATP